MTESKDQAVARIANAMDLDITDSKGLARSLIKALHEAYSTGFNAGWELCNENHSRSMEMLEKALANRND